MIAVIHNTLRGVPIDLRELVLDERDNGDALRRRMQAGDISVDENLTRYHDEYRRSFRESDSGRRFEDAFQVIITRGRQQIDEALRAIAKTPYLAGESGVLLGRSATNWPASTTASKPCAARCASPTRRSAGSCASKPTLATVRCSPA